MVDVGRVGELWRYPVKSMGGERLADAQVAPGTGIDGDRAFALVDSGSGAIASAKHPRKWGPLLACSAAFTDARTARIALPDGTRLDSSQSDIDARLTAAFGHAVRLSSTPPRQATFEEWDAASEQAKGVPLSIGAGAGTFFDFAPIHLVTTATLARLRELLPASQVERARFRPNLIVDTGAARGFVETDWNGRRLMLGDEVELCVVFTCPRCVMTTLAQPDLPADPAILRAAAEHNAQWFPLLAKKLPTVGMYATVLRGGTVRAGDAVRLGPTAPQHRLGAFARAIGRVVRRR